MADSTPTDALNTLSDRRNVNRPPRGRHVAMGNYRMWWYQTSMQEVPEARLSRVAAGDVAAARAFAAQWTNDLLGAPQANLPNYRRTTLTRSTSPQRIIITINGQWLRSMPARHPDRKTCSVKCAASCGHICSCRRQKSVCHGSDVFMPAIHLTGGNSPIGEPTLSTDFGIDREHGRSTGEC